MEKDKILYCFKLDEKNAEITRYEIDNYQEKEFYGKKHIVYHHKLDSKYATNHDVLFENFDKVIHMKIHTFNPDLEYAIKIIVADLVAKREKAYNDYQRWNELIVHLNKNN